MKAKKSVLILVVYYLCSLLIIGLGVKYFPEKYFIDTNRIFSILNGLDSFSGKSFSATAFLYQLLYFNTVPSMFVAGIINYHIVLFILVAIYRSLAPRWNVIPYVLMSAWAMMLSLFLGMYSKEFFTFLMVSMLFYAYFYNSNKFIIAAFLIFLLYGIFVREYYLIIIGEFLIIQFVVRYFRIKVLRVSVLLSYLLVKSMAFKYLIGLYITDFRTLLTTGKEGSDDAVTLMNNLMSNSSVFTDIANNFYVWFTFLIPFPLFKTAAPQHVLFALMQIVTVFTFVYIVRKLYKNHHKYEHIDTTKINFIVSFVLAFTFVHSAFEGDFGSYARHQIVLLPLYFYLLLVFFGNENQIQKEIVN